MNDYGHELSFGTFIAPESRWARDVVELARVSERAGLDLVTFMDHPYEPAMLDTWTLLSYMAAATERVHLSGYVLNLPSRHPALLARSAASLDLLSGGRVELGLGPGDTFALEAAADNGAPRRSAPQAVAALEEAVEIIRAIWDVDEPENVTHEGEHYHLRGARRGPRPAHQISIWLPAEGPRTRRLVGRRADGWITGGAWMSDVDRELAIGNEMVDEAAIEAGREPGEIRRIFDFSGTFAAHGGGLVQGSPERWAERLTQLAVEQGVSTFVLIGRDPAAIERFGAEVVPAVREAVSRDRVRAARGAQPEAGA